MPELPEVEVVRRGLAPYVTGRRIRAAEVLHPRSARRHESGAAGLEHDLAGCRVRCVSRRGKYLWMPLDDADDETALVAHLGMSGQLLLPLVTDDESPHLRVRLRFDEGERDLHFVDQRMFGGLYLDTLVADGADGQVPASVRHIARDPLDPLFDDAAFSRAMRRRSSGVKRCLLDQSLVSGVGNIYADEALWRSRLHYDREARRLGDRAVRDLLGHVREVMVAALAQGGTSFDSLYVDVNGRSGYFDRSLDAYGQEGEPCRRCGSPIVREPFMNRSSYRCPRCQRRPPGRSAPGGN